MIRGISKSETQAYVCEGDPAKGQPDEDQNATKFVLGSLDAEARMFITDNTVVQTYLPEGGARLEQKTGMRALTAVRFGLRGWKNFQGPDGSQLEFKTVKHQQFGKDYEVPTPECLGMLGTDLIMELGRVILERNTVVDQLAKN